MATAPTIAPPIPYAGYVGANMVSPVVPFVDAEGIIAPVNWRFLYEVFTGLNNLYQSMTTQFTNVENQLTAIFDQVQINTTDIAGLQSAVTNLENSVNAIDAEITNIENSIAGINGEIATINSRLAAAGIP